jgi:hypothetical protein
MGKIYDIFTELSMKGNPFAHIKGKASNIYKLHV